MIGTGSSTATCRFMLKCFVASELWVTFLVRGILLLDFELPLDGIKRKRETGTIKWWRRTQAFTLHIVRSIVRCTQR